MGEKIALYRLPGNGGPDSPDIWRATTGTSELAKAEEAYFLDPEGETDKCTVHKMGRYRFHSWDTVTFGPAMRGAAWLRLRYPGTDGTVSVMGASVLSPEAQTALGCHDQDILVLKHPMLQAAAGIDSEDVRAALHRHGKVYMWHRGAETLIKKLGEEDVYATAPKTAPSGAKLLEIDAVRAKKKRESSPRIRKAQVGHLYLEDLDHALTCLRVETRGIFYAHHVNPNFGCVVRRGDMADQARALIDINRKMGGKWGLIRIDLRQAYYKSLAMKRPAKGSEDWAVWLFVAELRKLFKRKAKKNGSKKAAHGSGMQAGVGKPV